MARERLQKILAQAGHGSRRKAEQLITAGRVRVNGQVVTEMGSTADADRDRIELDGARVLPQDHLYVLLHKPRGVVSTMDDPEGRDTVAGLVAPIPARLFPVGRLDYATSGVLLMTNDGAFADGLLRPRRGVPKIYVVKVTGSVSAAVLHRWSNGIQLEDGITLPAEVRVIRTEDRDKTWMEVVLREGRNQQLRRMAEATGLRVMRLARTSFAGIECGDLRPGKWRFLSVDELRAVRKQYGVPARIHKQAPVAPAGRRPTQSKRKTAGGRPPTGSRASADSSAKAGRSGRSGTKPRAAGRRASRGPGRGRR